MAKRIITATELANFLGLPTDGLLSFVVTAQRMSVNIDAKYLAATINEASVLKKFIAVELRDEKP